MSFWTHKTLAEMDNQEWEALCDGCGQCCLHKLEDEDTGEIALTRVACQLLDLETCRCQSYADRTRKVPGCIELKQYNISELSWLPSSCAYRLLSENKSLPNWHPLISKNADSVVKAGVSVANFAVSESEADDLEDYIIAWLR